MIKVRQIGLICMGITVIVYGLFSIHYYDVDKAVAYLTENAKAKSQQECARYVRLAIKAGGCPTYFHPASAKEYDIFLPKLGFAEISITNYVPLKGDVIVIKPPQNQFGHEHGHIAMFNGKKWISDFMQRDMYGGVSIARKELNTTSSAVLLDGE